jgi:hypothetical protein
MHTSILGAALETAPVAFSDGAIVCSAAALDEVVVPVPSEILQEGKSGIGTKNRAPRPFSHQGWPHTLPAATVFLVLLYAWLAALLFGGCQTYRGRDGLGNPNAGDPDLYLVDFGYLFLTAKQEGAPISTTERN